MPKRTKTNNKIKKKAVIDAFVKCFGNITMTCKVAGICRYTFYEWLENDEEFKKSIENSKADEYSLDYAENILFKRLESSDACLIFFLKTKGKKRGYIEKIESENNNTNKTEINIPLTNFIANRKDEEKFLNGND